MGHSLVELRLVGDPVRAKTGLFQTGSHFGLAGKQIVCDSPADMPVEPVEMLAPDHMEDREASARSDDTMDLGQGPCSVCEMGEQTDAQGGVEAGRLQGKILNAAADQGRVARCGIAPIKHSPGEVQRRQSAATPDDPSDNRQEVAGPCAQVHHCLPCREAGLDEMFSSTLKVEGPFGPIRRGAIEEGSELGESLTYGFAQEWAPDA